MSENIKDALEYAVDLSSGQEVIHKIENHVFYDSNKANLRNLFPAKYADPLEVNSLSGLVQYLLSKFDQELSDDPDELLVHVKSPTKVVVYSQLNAERKRESLIAAQAELQNYPYGQFLDQERFVINIKSLFDRTDDAEAILRFSSAIKIENSADVKDNGVTQTATVRTGAKTVAEGEVPSPAVLRPFRTFLEVEQPESQFVFRINERGNCALFEADGGLWKYHAKESIHEYLKTELEELIDQEKITIIL